MPKRVGRSLPITPYRRLVTDLMHFSQQVPAVTAERPMDLSALTAARSVSAPRPSWTVIFSKAYAIVGRDYPELRRSYLKFPWPRLYEHPHSIAAINIERRLPNEDVVLFCLIRSPECRSLEAMEAMVRHHRDEPVEKLRCFQRSVGMSRIPSPFRRWVWWTALNAIGRRRCHNFGTYSVSSIASQGAGLLTLVPILTSALHYGLFEADGRLNVRITFDHRVMDGAAAARILVDLESVLNREMVRELAGSRLQAA
ncbi:MAG TPA: 2-oxo acid dehydrogenase subunit E2 [Urbifossiella sp.]|nr:2-oxo acid dehydrogenase subunit E2 [Urbifossiella sp.]